MRLAVHDAGRASLRRAGRTAIVMPALFGVCTVAFGNLQLSLFAAFGSFAMLAFADFGGPSRKRAGAYVLLTAGGAVLISIATPLSGNAATATAGMAVVAFAATFGGVLGGYVAAGGLAATLSFVLAVAVPQDAPAIPARLAGWCLAGLVCTVAALVLWPRHDRGLLRRLLGRALAAEAELVEALLAADASGGTLGDRTAVAAKTTRELERQYRSMQYRPAGPTAHDQAIAYLIDELSWFHTFAAELAADRTSGGPFAPEDVTLGSATALILRDVASDLGGAGYGVDGRALEGQREHYYEAVARSLARRVENRDDFGEIGRHVDRSFRLRVLSYLSMSIAENASILGGRRVDPLRFEIPPLVPSGSLTGAARSLATIVRGHLRVDSVWFRAGLRAAIALGLAILIADLARLEHAFWVVLGTMSVLKSNAVTTSHAAWQALAGTLAGFGLATALLLVVNGSRPALWVLLPICVFLAVYTPTVVHVIVGQAMFTVTVVVLFNLIQPQGWRTGLIRFEDILIGSVTSVVVGVLLWPRGARGQLRRALSELFDAGGSYVKAAIEAGLGRVSDASVATHALAAQTSGLRAGDAFATFLNERGPKRLPMQVYGSILGVGEQLRLVGDAIVTRTRAYGAVEGFAPAVASIEHELVSVSETVDHAAKAIAGGHEAASVTRSNHPAETATIIRDCVEASGREPSRTQVEQMLGLAWTSNWMGHVEHRLGDLAEPLDRIGSDGSRSWWR